MPITAADEVTVLPGLGPAAAELLGARGITRVGDLPFVVPTGYDDLRAPIDVADALASAAERGRVAVRGTVLRSGIVPVRGRPSVRVVLGSEGSKATLSAWWFFAAHGILAAAKPGARVILSGRLSPTRKGDAVAMSHPDLLVDDGSDLGVRPRYPRLGLPPARLAKAVSASLDALPQIPDPVPPFVREREGMPPIRELLDRIHRPEAPPERDDVLALRTRLAFSEAFTRAWERAEGEASLRGQAIALPPNPGAVERLRIELGFAWTEGQARAIDEIAADLSSSRPMRRLLFGDVGSGKTAVALAAAAQAISAGTQTAILAPTSVLAEQYLEATGPLARALKAKIALFTSLARAAERRHLLRALGDGTLDVVVGTHALLQEDVRFHKLGLVIVDEQQRLGVAQRLSLVRKGEGAEEATRPHLITLSATPIPRTLALAIRGELAQSSLDERPPGRTPVKTYPLARPRFDDVAHRGIRTTLEKGGRVFVVCPRIGGDEDEEDAVETGPSCIERAESLARVFGEKAIVLAHGAMKPAALTQAMRSFRSGDTPILVGTTVVEVGVDVPEATLMIIDGAEHFGLAQLHQLRGRVGRGEKPGICLLVHDVPLGAPQKARLEALCRFERGADIAREDLRLRGSGDLGGTRQSGQEGLLYLDPLEEPPWLGRLGEDVARLRAEDPKLEKPEHLGLRLALERTRRALAVREEAG